MLSNEQKEANKVRFNGLIQELMLLKPDKSSNFTKLLEWLNTTDFFEAPADPQYFNNYDGGLCEHSLKVYDELEKLCALYNVTEEEIPKYSRIIVALFHDFHKINKFEKTTKSLPKKDDKGNEIKDEYGKLIWEKQEIYSYIKNPDLNLGNSPKSIYIIMHFITLNSIESEAIFSYKGAFDLSDYFTKAALAQIFTKNKLAYLLHVADMSSIYLK